MRRLLPSPKRAGFTGSIGALTLLACLSIPAADGKGKPGGSEDPAPDPTPASPIRYAVTWLTAADPPDESKLWDIDSNGVAVGQIRPNGSVEDRYGIVSFPGRAPINLEALVQAGNHQGDLLPAGWKLNAVETISEDLVIGGDIIPAEGSGYLYGCFAAKLIDITPRIR